MHSLHLEITGTKVFDGLPARSTLRRWILRSLESRAAITLAFVGARAGRKLNRDFRGRDYATNVLTFAYRERAPIEADIVLCMPVVAREARAQSKTLRQHLAHLVVHGVLHAHGHDHVRAAQARAMQARETEILAGLRIPDPYREESGQSKRRRAATSPPPNPAR